ncbi:hypothetical protein C8Q79DRAFT_1014750 [Trametes meyenii]|nr:hypothetical protein C8Q79DRAFT_1014750 [Trametes meyenii]
MSMTTNGTSPSAVPTGLTTAVDLSSSLSILLVGTVGSSFLIPIATSLLYFVKNSEKRGLTFIMIAASLVLGLGEGGLNMYNQINTIRKKPVPSAVNTAYTMVHLFLPLFSEFTMVLRVGRSTPIRGRAASWLRKLWTYGPMLVLKILRFIVLVSIAVTWVTKSVNLPRPVQGGLDALSAINQLPSQLRWALQSADTLFMAVLLFPWPHWKKDKHGHHGKHGAHDHHTADDDLKESLWVRFKTFFWDAVFSFLIPVALNLVQFALVLAQDGVLKFPSLFAVNNQLGIIGMVFATIWAPGSPSRHDHARGRPHTTRSRTAPPALGGAPRSGADTRGVGDRASTTSSGNASASGSSARQRPGARRHASEMTLVGAGGEKVKTPTSAGLFSMQSLGEESCEREEYDEKASVSGSEHSTGRGDLVDGVSHLLGGFGGDVSQFGGIAHRVAHFASGVRGAVGHGIEEVEDAVHGVGDRVRDVEHRVEDELHGMSEKVQGKMHEVDEMIHGAGSGASGAASASKKATSASKKATSATPTKKTTKAGATPSGDGKKTSSSVGEGRRRESSGSLGGVLGGLKSALFGNSKQRADDLEAGIRDLAARGIDAAEDEADHMQGKVDSALARAGNTVREATRLVGEPTNSGPLQDTHATAVKSKASIIPPTHHATETTERNGTPMGATAPSGYGLDTILTQSGLGNALLGDTFNSLEHRTSDFGGDLTALTARGASQARDTVDGVHDRFEQTLEHARSSMGASDILALQSSSVQDAPARRKATREMSGATLVEGKPEGSESPTSALATSMRPATQVGVARGVDQKASRARGDLGAVLGGGVGLGVGGALLGGALGGVGGSLGAFGQPVDLGGVLDAGLESVGFGMSGEGRDGQDGQSVGHGDEGARSVYDAESGGESGIGRALDSC